MEFIDIFLDKSDKSPLYYQLYQHLAQHIREGGISAGEKLPGKRSAAAQLGVSVNTVNEAYQQLATEGYIAAKPRSGFVVMRLQQTVFPFTTEKSFSANDFPTSNTTPLYSFSSSGLDAELFPLKIWNRTMREVLTEKPDLFHRGRPLGDFALCEGISSYLKSYRGVRCDTLQVVTGAGLEILFSMLVRLFADKTFALENPGYSKTSTILQNMGAHYQFVSVDNQGMIPDELLKSGAQIAYLTPSHQLPTGGVMSAPRRSELLSWATEEGHLIIEDDYDSEFRFDGRPLPCLQGMDEHNSVVYAGTFTRSLAPGLRAAYLVLPPPVLELWKKAYGGYSCSISRPDQYVLAKLLSEGHFARSLNRARNTYRRRRDALLSAFSQIFPADGWHAENTHTGLYFVLRLPGKDAVHLAQLARDKGLYIHSLAEYHNEHLSHAYDDALMVGYGGLLDEDILPATKALADIFFT